MDCVRDSCVCSNKYSTCTCRSMIGQPKAADEQLKSVTVVQCSPVVVSVHRLKSVTAAGTEDCFSLKELPTALRMSMEEVGGVVHDGQEFTR